MASPFKPISTITFSATLFFLLTLVSGCGGGGGTEAQPDQENRAPVGNAGNDVTVTVGDMVTMNGTASDADGDTPLNYIWDLQGQPVGSVAQLQNSDTRTPSFTPDVVGNYTLVLIVNDGQDESTPDSVIVTAQLGNAAPVANSGDDQFVTVPSTVQLDGSNSFDSNGDNLSYQWSFADKPIGSQASFDNPLTQNPSFVTDVAGQYRVQLIVNDGEFDSNPDDMVVTAAQFSVQVNWIANTDNPAGYVVYIGSTANTVEIPIKILVRDAADWDPANPSVILPDTEILDALGNGSQACVAIAAYNGAGRSPISGSSCVTLPI